MIYFDNSSTSPVDAEVLEAMLPYLKEEYGNPSSKYYLKAVNAAKAVENAREQVAKLIGANHDEIVFTSGSTESTNFIIKGYMDYRRYYKDGKNHIITSMVEHKATLNTCKYLSGELYSNNDPTISLFGDKKKVDRGYEVTFVETTNTGEITVDSIEQAIKKNTALVSVIYVNNEVGTISDIKSIADVSKKHGLAIHSDITQAIGKIDLNVHHMNLDYASCSAHKVYGPKGIGAAYLRADQFGIEPITALLHGGEQENGLRAGTLAVHNIVGFGTAAEIAKRDLALNERRIKKLDRMLIEAINNSESLRLTNPSMNRLPGTISVIVDKKNFNNERFIKRVSDKFAFSTGSACSAGEPSYVIKALGLQEQVTKVIRITINKYTTEEDVTELINFLSTEL